TIFIIFITIIFCCPTTVLAGNTPNKKKPGVHQLHSPIRLAMTPEGNLLVSDYQLGMIVTVDHKSLKATRWFPVQGRPLGVAYARGHIYVGNTSKKCVEVYARGGKKLYQFSGVIKQPTDIAIDEKKGLVFVVDGSQKNVKVFNLKGNFILSFPGTANNLVNPTGITLDPAAGEVFVSDYGDLKIYVYPRIQIFDYNGNLLDTIKGKQGMFGVRFSRPQGLAVDESGNVFMVDCYSGEIMVFDRYTGQTLKTMAGYGTDPGQLRLPLDMVMNPSSKDIYITNNRSAAIEIFEKGGVL
ncbi:NHL repeat-containing protein, partial [Acidobacteriota bacterium]